MSIWSNIGGYLLGILKGIAGQLGASTETFLKSFVETDLGKLAIDAVEWAQTEVPGGGTAARDAAKQKLITDAKAAGQDISTFAESLLNFLIETALQAVLSKTA